MNIKKIARFIIEINAASFAWYIAAAALITGSDYAYPELVRKSGIPLQALAWFIGVSVILRVYAYVINWRNPRKKADDVLRKIVNRLRPSALSISASVFMLWALFIYEGNQGIYRTLGASGLPINLSIVIFLILYWFIFLNAIQEENSQIIKEVSALEIKKIYEGRREYSATERLSPTFPLRRYVHETEYAGIARHVRAGESVLDAGCGDGSLAVLLALKRADVTACDISPENIAATRKQASENNVLSRMTFATCDAENLPFPDNSFDWVISSHVLEHLPHFEKGLAEIRRVTKKRAVIAMPTCLNPCAAVILGGDTFWTLSRWSLTAWFVGFIRILLNFGGEGVDEGYAGDTRLPHLWRYPWVMRRKIRMGGLRVISFQASSICLPYAAFFLPLARKMERYATYPIIRNLGYGSIAVVEK